MASVLIIATWFMWGLSIFGVGWVLSRVFARSCGFGLRVRFSLWVGLFSLVVLSLVLNFILPLQSSAVRLLAVCWVLAGSGVSLFVWLRNGFLLRKFLHRGSNLLTASRLIMLALVFASVLLVANFATGEPMDYDAGLYRLGLLNYASEYRVIPGLANIHGRFGFNSAVAPLGAFLGTLVWNEESFRLLTGFVYSIFAVDLGVRIVRSRRRGPGDFFFAIGWAFILWMILDDAGRWVPSPGQDMIALILTVAAFAYLIDYLDPHGRNYSSAVIAILIAALAAAIRPLGWVALPFLFAVIVSADRLIPPDVGRPRLQLRDLARPLFGVTLMALLMGIRDVVLSGWLFFPASLFPVPVDWRHPDPETLALGITWWARAPWMTVEEAREFEWFGPWVESTVASREVQFLAVLLVILALPLLSKAGRRAWRNSALQIALALVPAFVLSVAWFVVAPDLRFGWGGLIALVGVPLAFLLANFAFEVGLFKVIFFSLLIVGVVWNLRLDRFDVRGNPRQVTSLHVAGSQIDVKVSPPLNVETTPGFLKDGTPVVFPRDGENCYMEFPLCLLPNTGMNVSKRGDTIQDGFRIDP